MSLPKSEAGDRIVVSSPPSANRGKSRTDGRSVIRLLRVLGPGLITGASDDDPSAIATYSIAGARLGTGLLWTAVFTWPLMAAIQMMCARIGFVTGKGLVGALRERYPKSLLVLVSGALLFANTVTIGADLSAMADVAEMVTTINSHYFIILFGLSTAVATIHFRYHQIVDILKWLALALLAYVVVAIGLAPDWSSLVRSTIIPAWPRGDGAWATLVAVLGTTISPYIFFWQASHEVEVKKSHGHTQHAWTAQEMEREMRERASAVGTGSFFSNLVMYFIILTAALTFHVHGVTNLETSAQAARALTPLAGKFSGMLFALGVIGAGLLAIPTLTGSAAYALAETFAWRHGLNEKFAAARPFYLVIVLSTSVGVVLDFSNANPVQALFFAAVLNGLLAPLLLVGILVIACDRRIMGSQASPLLNRALVSLTALLMAFAAIGMFVF